MTCKIFMENKNAYPLVLKVLKILGPLRDFAIVDRMKCIDLQALFCVVLIFFLGFNFIYVHLHFKTEKIQKTDIVTS